MYPISLNLQGKKCIVFGAGKVAQRRVWGLLDAGAEVTVAAPEKMPACWETARLTYLEQAYAPELLEEQFLVFAATDDSAENARIVRDAQAAGKLVSSATVSPDSTPDFAVPAHRRHGDVTISVATEGDAPALAGAICRELEPKLASYSEICTCLGVLRRTWKETIPDDFHRMQLLRMLTEPKALELFQEKGKGAYLAYASSLADGEMPAVKKAILMVSFGTSYADTREHTIGAVERAVQVAFPEMDVFRAFTSGMIIRKMRRQGNAVDTVREALEKLKQQGYTHVYLQPTHVIPGEEYDRLCADAAAYTGAFAVMRIGKPLLTETADYPALVQAMEQDGVIRKSAEKAYLLMGHGTPHIINQAYPAFDYWLKRSGFDNVFVGTVEGYPTLETLLELLKEHHYREVVLVPMMLVAGDHAQNDMAGDDSDSWKSVLERYGYIVTPQLQGLGAYPAVQALYIAHTAHMLEQSPEGGETR